MTLIVKKWKSFDKDGNLIAEMTDLEKRLAGAILRAYDFACTNCDDNYEGPCRCCVKAAKATTALLKSQGLTIVPIEPTVAMRIAADATCPGPDPYFPDTPANVYRAMIAAYTGDVE